MRVNVKKFKELIKKATLNLSIDSVQLDITTDRIESRMVTAHSDGVVLLDVENDIITEMATNDDFQLNFSEPNLNLIPFLNLIDEDEANLFVHENRITMTVGRQRSNVYFCSPTVVSVFSAGTPLESINYFLETQIDENFVEAFKKIRKVGTKFGRVYLNVEENTLSIEATDKRNTVSNTLKFDLLDDIEHDDMSICFAYDNFQRLMSLILDDYEDFELKVAYIDRQELGMIYIRRNDGSENFFLMSKVE
jgi:hypothetical protein